MTLTKTALDTFFVRMHAVLKDRLRTDAEALDAVRGDESHEPVGHAVAVVRPGNTAEVCHIAQEAAALGVPLVPGVGGQARPGGASPMTK